MSVPALVPLHHDPAFPAEPRPGGGEPPIFQPLPETDIGFVYRGDTIILPEWFARDYYNQLIDLTGATIWFTAKVDLEEGDLDPDVIQVSTRDTWVTIVGPPVDGRYQVTIHPGETLNLLDDTVFIFDVQVVTAVTAAEPRSRTLTVKRGVMTVIRDVTITSA
jgi:hypothetical protein